MIRVDVHEAKAHLSHDLDRLEAGERIVLCRRNVPVAELRPWSEESTAERPLGVARELYGDWELPESFFEPLPEPELQAFEGEGLEGRDP